MRHGKKQQSWFIILFLCIMVSINNADLRGQKFPGSGGGSAGSLSPAQPGRAGSAPGSSPGLMPAAGLQLVEIPPETPALRSQRETMSSRMAVPRPLPK